MQRNNGWKDSKYRGVIVYVMMENINYNRIDHEKDGEWYVAEVAEYDSEPQIWGWNVFDPIGTKIQDTLEVKHYPKLEDVEKYIDERLAEDGK